jgi:LPXTG-site transpeptidase (sortase) family protein
MHVIYEYTPKQHRLLLAPLTLAPIALLLFFFTFVVRIVLPVVWVESQYEYHKVLKEVFRVNDIRSLILPKFHFDTHTNTYDVNGINIPSIFVDEPITFNVDPNDTRAYSAALKIGIAHASGSGFPGTGRLGYYFAHSSNPELAQQYNAVFYLLGKLQNGDDVIIWHEGKEYPYKVMQKLITSPRDVSFLTRSYPKETIVLQTCWPPGTTLQRLLVFAQAQ